MAVVQKSTITVQFLDIPRTTEGLEVMHAFVNETVRLLNWTLKRKAKDPEQFESNVSYGWFQIPEEVGTYCIQVVGEHVHQDVREVGDQVQERADKGGYPIVINVLRM